MTRINWPSDLVEQIKLMRETGMTWEDMADELKCNFQTLRKKAIELGVHKPAEQRLFTPEEDSIIARDWKGNVDLHETAKKLNRSFGVVRQRLFHKPELKGGYVRTVRGQRAINTYGTAYLPPMLPGETHDQYGQRIRQLVADASAEAKRLALAAKRNHHDTQINLMCEAIAKGKDRNEAIFECRQSGVSLERIAAVFKITRERVRQICDQHAFTYAMKKANETQSDTGSVAQPDPIRTGDGVGGSEPTNHPHHKFDCF